MSPDDDGGSDGGDMDAEDVRDHHHDEDDPRQPPFKLWLDRCVAVDGVRGYDEEGERRCRRSLRDASRDYFRSVTTEDDVVDGALARLVADLGPAFAPPPPSGASPDDSEGKTAAIVRARALHLLTGAMEGCLLKGEEEKSSSSSLSPQVLRSVGTFLLPHCAYRDGEYEMAELAVRSSAVACLSVLLRSTARLKLEEMDEIRCEEAGRVLRMGREGVAHLCATATVADHAVDGAGAGVEGLSDLPRARRSECFDLLSSALVGFSGYGIPPPPSEEESTSPPPKWRKELEVEMFTFASFACLCLRGETDPRCLVQLLDVLHACQRSFLPLFSSASDYSDDVRGGSSFPTVEMFDAVAPYYPIHFTPPPNDVHKITRDDLRYRLMAVLCCPSSSSSSPHGTSGEEGGGGGTSMIALSCHLFLERVRGGAGGGDDEEDEEVTPRDQLEAIEDLRTLLRLGPEGEGGGVGGGGGAATINRHVILELDDGASRDLSNALATVFQSEAMTAAAEPEESFTDEEVEITVAKGCTSLAVEFLSTLERIISADTAASSSTAAKSLWEAFFDASTLTRMTSRAAAEPETSMGRVGVGYLAAIAVAGPETLRRCWDSCVPPFLAAVTRYSSEIDGSERDGGGRVEAAGRATAALRGLAALHSACLEVGRGGARGVGGAGVPAVHRYHPDPISRKYASDVFPVLLRIGRLEGGTPPRGDGPDEDSSTQMAAAAVSALETLLLAAPATSLPTPPDENDGGDDEDVGGASGDSWGRKGVARAIDRLVDAIIATTSPSPYPPTSARPWREACGRAVGSIIGSATSDEALVVPSDTADGGRGDDDDDDGDGQGGEKEGEGSGGPTTSLPAAPSASSSGGGCLASCLDNAELLVITDRLVNSAVTAEASADGDDVGELAPRRCDWSALARACLLSGPAADVVVEELASLAERGLHEASIVTGGGGAAAKGRKSSWVANPDNADGDDDIVAIDPKSAAMALSYVVRRGGDNAVEAWRSLSIDRVVGIVEAAFPSGVSKREMGGASDGRLVLPGGEVKDRVEKAVRSASNTLPHLIPCYERCGPQARLAIGRRLVSPILPPLSEMDQAKLRIALPILAAALTTSMDEGDSDAIGESVTGEIAKVLPCLCDYALSADTKGPARSAAVSCIYSIIYHGWQGGDGGGGGEEGSLASPILRDSVWPAVIESAEATDFARDSSAFVDAVNLAAIVGSAAACHGGSSASAADSVVKFLVCLCCDGTVYSPVTDTYTLVTDPCAASVVGGSAIGNFLAVEGGGPFWRQRACALALPDLLRACRNTFRGGSGGDIGMGPAIGVAHFVCCVPMPALGTDADSVVELVDAILRGLVLCYPDGGAATAAKGALARGNARMLAAERRFNGSGYATSALAALLKLFSSSPKEAITPILSSVLVIQILLRIITEVGVVVDRDAALPTHDVSRKLLALQCLLLISSRFPEAKGNRLQRANVVGGLSVVIDHPSRDVRRAAVRVRNVWSLMDGPKR